jgi:hypothetical protein
MKRYHKKIFFPQGTKDCLLAFCDKLNVKAWTFSRHCIDGLQYRAVDVSAVLQYIKKVQLKAEDIFEYYIFNETVIKTCYRITYSNNIDIVLVISNDKNIITIYTQDKNDEHYTLNTALYNKE